MPKAVWTTLLLAALCPLARADQVVLNDGRSFSGKVVEEGETHNVYTADNLPGEWKKPEE